MKNGVSFKIPQRTVRKNRNKKKFFKDQYRNGSGSDSSTSTKSSTTKSTPKHMTNSGNRRDFHKQLGQKRDNYGIKPLPQGIGPIMNLQPFNLKHPQPTKPLILPYITKQDSSETEKAEPPSEPEQQTTEPEQQTPPTTEPEQQTTEQQTPVIVNGS